MFEWLSMARILHVIAAVFMAAPLYMLIVVGERGAFGRRIDAAMDGYMERIVSGQPRRCYAYVAVLFFTGLALLILTGQGLAPVVTNWTVALKVVLTLAVLGIITYVHMVLQPQVNHLVASAETEDVAVKVWPLRSLRKRLAAVCLFLVLTIVLLGIRLVVPYSAATLLLFLILAAMFAWRAFRVPVPWGFG